MKVNLKTFNILDIAILQLLVICLALSDFRLLSIISTVFAFGVIALFYFKRNALNRQVLYFAFFKLLFIIWALFSCLWSVNVETSFSYTITLCLRLMLSLSIILYVDSKDKLYKLLKMIVFATFVLCIRIIFVVPISAYGEARIGNYLSFDERSSYGNTGLTYVLGVTSVILLCSDRVIIKNQVLKYFLAILFSVFSLLSGSKKQIIFLIVAILILAFKQSKNTIKVIRNCLIAVICIAVMLYIIFSNELLYNSIGSRLESMLAYFFGEQENADLSTINRALYARYAWQVFLENPFFGIGLDGFQYVNPITQCWAECNFVELLADLGIVGFVLYYIPHLMILKGIINRFSKRNSLDYILLSMLVVIIVIDISMVSYRSVPLQIWLAVAFGLNLVRMKNEKSIEYRYTSLVKQGEKYA